MKTAIVVGFLILVAVVASASDWRFFSSSGDRGDLYYDAETISYAKKTLFGFTTGEDKNYVNGWIKSDKGKDYFRLDCADRTIYIEDVLVYKRIAPDTIFDKLRVQLCP